MDETFKLLLEIQKVFGPYLGALVLIALLLLIGILFFFKSRLIKIADEISDKSINLFNRKLELAFRDENIRTELQASLASKSIEIKLEYYKNVYELYFEFLESWGFDKNTPKEVITKLWNKILRLRKELFLNSIYLGGELTENLLKAVITMSVLLSNIENKIKGIIDSTANDPQSNFNTSEKLSQYLRNCEDYINKNIMTDQNLSMYDFTGEQKEYLDKQKENLFKSGN